MNNTCFYHCNRLIKIDEFWQHISLARESIKSISGNRCLLFHADSYLFSVMFFALLLEKKHILLPPNKQVGTIRKLTDLCDATVGDISVTHKPMISPPSFNFDQTLSNATICIQDLIVNISGQLTFFTSGSTGEPKAIVKQFHQLSSELLTLQDTFAKVTTTANLVLSTVSHQHIYGLLFKILFPLISKKTIVSHTFEYPEHINTELSTLSKQLNCRDLALMLVSSPAHLNRLVVDNVLSPYAKNYQCVFSSGGLLPVATSQLFESQMGMAPIEILGSTETGGIAWRDKQKSVDTPWRVFTVIEYTVQPNTQRLIINSPFVNNSEYLTEDIVEPIDQQHFKLNGRMDRTVKIEEKRINLSHLEENLRRHPWVIDAKMLVANMSQNTFNRQAIFSVLIINKEAQKFVQEHGKQALNQVLKQHLLLEFERICIPRKWRYVEDFPYNSQGKLVLKELENLFD